MFFFLSLSFWLDDFALSAVKCCENAFVIYANTYICKLPSAPFSFPYPGAIAYYQLATFGVI